MPVAARYTSLRVVDAGVVLFAQHRERLGPECQGAFDRFAATAAPGNYVLSARGVSVDVAPRGPTRLRDGIPTRLRPSPLPPGLGPQPKAPSPGPYDSVREMGWATLLTDAGSTEIIESCSAAVLGWDGKGLVAAPEDRSRVASTAERAILSRLTVRRAPLRLAEGWPIILINALVLTAVPEGSQFPLAVRAQLDEVLGRTTRRAPPVTSAAVK